MQSKALRGAVQQAASELKALTKVVKDLDRRKDCPHYSYDMQCRVYAAWAEEKNKLERMEDANKTD